MGSNCMGSALRVEVCASIAELRGGDRFEFLEVANGPDSSDPVCFRNPSPATSSV